jgi:hypothetical protein
MNFQKILNVLQLIKNYQEIVDSYRLEQYYKSNHNYINNDINKIENIENSNNIISRRQINKMIIYKSKIVHKIELSIELLYNIFFKNNKKKGLDKNIFFNFVFELIKCGLKIKEMNSLNKIGIPFYVDEKIFYNDFLGIDKNKYIDNIINSNDDNNINNINNIIFPIQGNLFLPIKEKINNNKYKNKFINDLISDNNEFTIITKNNKYYIGEIIYLLRPVIYITLLIIFKDNKIIPLIINIILDIIIYFSRLEINKDNYKKFKLNFLLQKINYLEMKFRNKHFFAYIFREPIFSYIIIPLTEKIFNILPIPNFIVRIIMNILDNYSSYTYIA